MIVRIIGGHGNVAKGFKATSYLVDDELLIDAGSVASGLTRFEQRRLNNILISHSHLDHIYELAFLADSFFEDQDKSFDIYTSQEARKNIIDHLFNDSIWPDFTTLDRPFKKILSFHEFESQKKLTLNNFSIIPVKVNHPAGAHGFIITNNKSDDSLIFTQDTGPTNLIWELGLKVKNLKGIFTEVSFPNRLARIAKESCHHTPASLFKEINKMPKDVPIVVGHLKPHMQDNIYQEVKDLKEPRIVILEQDEILISL